MKLNTDKKVIHPILFGIYPVLALYYFNRHEIVFSALGQAFITALFMSLVIIAVFLIFFRSWNKAAIHSSLFLLLFYSYGHIFDVLKNAELLGEMIGRHRYLIAAWIILFVGLELILKKTDNYDKLNETFNLTSLFLVGFLSVQFLIYFTQTINTKKISHEEISLAQEQVEPLGERRDVYYILVDAYSREDILKEQLDLDIGEFIAELEKLGFYIPNCTQSNYSHTVLSMASVLNMDYIDALGVRYDADKTEFIPYLQDSLVIKKFKDLDYRVATFKSLFPLLDMKDVDYYHDYFSKSSTFSSHAALNFQYLFLRTTILRPIIEVIEVMDDDAPYAFIAKLFPVKRAISDRDLRQYEQNIFALDSLENAPGLPGPKFVYAHLYVTHQPYVFYPDGRFHPDLVQTSSAYRDQVIFLNQRLLEIVKSILEESEKPPVIVIQSDHSYFQGADTVKILNAYYFPEIDQDQLYESITPVNTFRMIFNSYFGEEISLLPDVSKYVDADGYLQETPLTCVNP